MSDMKFTKRKKAIKKHVDAIAKNRNRWIRKNKFYYQNDYAYMCFLIGEKQKVLDLGCGTGQLLSVLKPSYGVGVDLSGAMI